MTKKSSNAGVSGETASTQDDMNILYTAHQVHTLAQLVFQHLTAGRLPRMGTSPFAPPPSAVFTPPQAMQQGWGSGCAVPGPPSGGPHANALFYWYP